MDLFGCDEAINNLFIYLLKFNMTSSADFRYFCVWLRTSFACIRCHMCVCVHSVLVDNLFDARKPQTKPNWQFAIRAKILVVHCAALCEKKVSNFTFDFIDGDALHWIHHRDSFFPPISDLFFFFYDFLSSELWHEVICVLSERICHRKFRSSGKVTDMVA